MHVSEQFPEATCQFLSFFVEEGTEEFEDFIHLLGDRIRLKNWDKYKAGLDTKSRSKFKLLWCFPLTHIL